MRCKPDLERDNNQPFCKLRPRILISRNVDGDQKKRIRPTADLQEPGIVIQHNKATSNHSRFQSTIDLLLPMQWKWWIRFFLVWMRIDKSNKWCPGILKAEEEESCGRTGRRPSEMTCDAWRWHGTRLRCLQWTDISRYVLCTVQTCMGRTNGED